MKIKINDRTVTIPRLFGNEAELNRLVVKHTAFSSFQAMLNAGGTYRPSIYLDGKTKREQRELVFIAIGYNTVQRNRGDARRVFKGDWRPVFRKEFPIFDETTLGGCTVPGCESLATDIAAISIDNQPTKNCAVCRCHYDAALEDQRVPLVQSVMSDLETLSHMTGDNPTARSVVMSALNKVSQLA